MSLRIRRKNNKIVCAAESKPREGDCYLPDWVQDLLVGELNVLRTRNAGETWYFVNLREEK